LTVQGVVATVLAIGPPIVAVALVGWALARLHPFLGLVFDVLVLYALMGFRRFSHAVSAIITALKSGDPGGVRRALAGWYGPLAGELSSQDVARLSIDRAVMEHTTRAAVVPVDMAWSDVGSWRALREIGVSDVDGNVFHGDVIADRVRNSYIRTEGKLIAAVGVDDLVIVATEDAILVTGADEGAQVSALVETLRLRNRSEPNQHT